MKNKMLGVNIDHIATLRNARGTKYPDPVYASLVAEQSGADSITVHLREDRRHITDRDIKILSQVIQTRMNLEIAATEEMIKIAFDTFPYSCCLVPENREELTTESGLDVISNRDDLKYIVNFLKSRGIVVSIFVNADNEQIEQSVEIGASCIEIHTGYYANAKNENEKLVELNKIRNSVNFAENLGISVNAGHGLDYCNVSSISTLSGIRELNIGHSIISRSIMVGLSSAIKEMKSIINS